jgi:hypothetical protein
MERCCVLVEERGGGMSDVVAIVKVVSGSRPDVIKHDGGIFVPFDPDTGATIRAYFRIVDMMICDTAALTADQKLQRVT